MVFSFAFRSQAAVRFWIGRTGFSSPFDDVDYEAGLMFNQTKWNDVFHQEN